jgi:hypothetical protein
MADMTADALALTGINQQAPIIGVKNRDRRRA